MIRHININPYKESLGGNNENHALWAENIRNIITSTLISIDLDKVDLYSLIHGKHQYEAGIRNQRLIIYANATFKDASKDAYMDEEGITINGVNLSEKETLPYRGGDRDILIKSTEGIAIAEYNDDKEELNILFNLFSEYSEERIAIFKYIMEQVESNIHFKRKLENSWLHTSDKESLTKRFLERVRQQKSQDLENDKMRLRELEQKIERIKRDIKSHWDNILRIRRNVENEKEYLKSVSTQFLKDLDLIIQHPKITDLHIVDGVFEFYTEDIYAYTKKDERFYIGKFKVTMNLDNTEVKFLNLNNRRRGYWTNQDHHPHVDGESGRACLGSVASTIAELASQNQPYALALICIDFLENANIEDPAGAKVYNWDRVDEEGKVISKGGERPTWVCDHCSERIDDNESSSTVYVEINDDDEPCEEITVCDVCLGEHYHWSEYYGEYVNNDIQEPEGNEE